MMLPAPKRDFLGFDEDFVHLATGGQPPLLKTHEAAFARFAADKARGQSGYEHHWQVGLETKALVARLTGIPAQDHAFVGSASEGISRVLSSFDWQSGDNVVVADKDYASGRFAMLRLAGLGVEPRVVPTSGWRIDPQRLVDACDRRTRLLYVSQVTSLTSQRFDLAWIAAALEGLNVALLVDASHAMGVIPVDGTVADFTVSSCYKFLCSTHMGILAWNRQRRPDFNPRSVGWASGNDSADGRSFSMHPDGARAQSGNANHLDVYLLQRSLEYLLAYGVDAIHGHVAPLTQRLHSGLVDLGLEVVTPDDPNEHASSVGFATAEDRELRSRAEADKIFVWDGGGRVRASVHLFNSDADVQHYLAWLANHLRS